MKLKKKQKQARMVYQSSSMADLPSHILMEIISRLPIQTVMAIRCVCKSLLSLVSDSHFQTLYSTRATTELFVSGNGQSSKTLSVADVFVDDSLTAVDVRSSVVFELPNFSVLSGNCCNFGSIGTVIRLVNSCCGLVCYKGPGSNRFAVVCNPFTLEYVTFPSPARMDKNVDTKGICYGLGFSPKDNKFKLLRFFDRKYVDADSGEETSRLVGEIYTFGESGSSWKRVANRPYLYQSLLKVRELIFHEGTLHWYSTLSNSSILTFDFNTELFGHLVNPPHMRDMISSKGRRSLGMGVFENCLYVTACIGDCVDIWVLKEYGQDSWIKMFSIREDVNSFSESHEQFKYWQTGQVLVFKKFGGIVCLNPNTGSFKHLDGLYGHSEAVFIRPSLVSLKVLLEDNVNVHSFKPWYHTKAAAIPPVWTSLMAVEDVVKANKDSQGCTAPSSSPSASEASASASHPREKAKEDVLPAILASQQGGADVGSFGSRDPRPPKDRRAGLSSSEIQKLADEIDTLKAEDERKGKAIETLHVENDRMGKVIAKLKQTKKEDRAFMRFIYQQVLSLNPKMPAYPMPDNFISSDVSD